MKAYIGAEVISAKPMNEHTFLHDVKGQSVPIPLEEIKPGYMVQHEDGYTSWSPAKAFERAYREVSTGEHNLIGEGD